VLARQVGLSNPTLGLDACAQEVGDATLLGSREDSRQIVGERRVIGMPV